MFIGHFAAAFAAKKADRKLSLGATFVAAQWLDLLWPVLLLTGIEHAEITTDAAAPLPLQFTDYPVSHSLLAVAGWSLLMGFLCYLLVRRRKAAILIAALVLSHWVLDWLVHVPDLPLSPFTDAKEGLGLWNNRLLSLALELVLFATGVYLYTTSTRAVNKKGSIGLWSLIIFLLVIHIMNTFGPPPPSVTAVAVTGLSQWILVLWAWWADKYRTAI